MPCQATTAPPPPLSESELIRLMEQHRIGTDASISAHIGTLEARKYVRVVEGRRFEPSRLGLALVEGLRRIDPELVEPTVRAHVEAQRYAVLCCAMLWGVLLGTSSSDSFIRQAQLDRIAKGELPRAAVVRH
jgi:hypothetical protein